MTTVTKTKPLISIVIPFKNEDINVQKLYDRLRGVFNDLKDYAYEFIYVDDGSTDGSTKAVRALSREDKSVRLVQLSRNFGKEIATTAGLHHAKGHAAIMIDADLQHPPELIPLFIEKWKDGFDVVVGKRRHGEYTSRLKRITSKNFYRFLSAISHVEIYPDATDFRLVDRCVIDEFNRFTERNRLTRGLIDWLGFSRAYIDFDADKRIHGKASYSFKKLMGLALRSTISMSFFPLYLAGYLGLFIVLISLPTGIFILIERFILNDPLHLHITGTATLAVILLFLVGIILICLGLIAMYIAGIYGEVVNRPLYIVKRRGQR